MSCNKEIVTTTGSDSLIYINRDAAYQERIFFNIFWMKLIGSLVWFVVAGGLLGYLFSFLVIDPHVSILLKIVIPIPFILFLLIPFTTTHSLKVSIDNVNRVVHCRKMSVIPLCDKCDKKSFRMDELKGFGLKKEFNGYTVIAIKKDNQMIEIYSGFETEDNMKFFKELNKLIKQN